MSIKDYYLKISNWAGLASQSPKNSNVIQNNNIPLSQTQSYQGLQIQLSQQQLNAAQQASAQSIPAYQNYYNQQALSQSQQFTGIYQVGAGLSSGVTSIISDEHLKRQKDLLNDFYQPCNPLTKKIIEILEKQAGVKPPTFVYQHYLSFYDFVDLIKEKIEVEVKNSLFNKNLMDVIDEK